jgi:hypothetical protein
MQPECGPRIALFVRYFFDTRDNGTFVEDDVGIDCADLDTVKRLAALSLAELARDVLPGAFDGCFPWKCAM